MAVVNPYLNFAGTTEEAFNFLRSVFGGKLRLPISSACSG
jgi:PhnB protein